MSEPRRYTLLREQMFDLEKTSRLAELFQVPREQRTSQWLEAFTGAVWHASLEVAEPAFFRGPDTFTYARLHIPTPGKPFQSNSLSNVARFAVERGAGIAIFSSPSATEPEYVLSMGRVDGLLRYDSWDGDPFDLLEVSERQQPSTLPENGMEIIAPREAEKLWRGSPADSFLPSYTAAMLHWHLTQGWKLENPRIALMVVQSMAPTRSLVIGKKMSEFPDQQTAAQHTRMLLWYLPPHRSLVLMPESWNLDEMRPLSDYFQTPSAAASTTTE